MNRAQKMAWFTLVMFALAVAMSMAAFSVAYLVFDQPARRAAGGIGFMGIVGLSGLAPLLFRKDKSQVQMDERDLLIKRKAMLGAYTAFWVLFVLAAMVPWFVVGPNGVITVNYLPWMVIGGIIVVALVQSIVTLEEYGWSDKENE